MNQNTPSLPGFEAIVQPFRFSSTPHEYRVQALRECPVPESLALCDNADKCVEYWQRHVATHPHFNPEVECLVVLILNARSRVKGHYLVATGTMDTILVHPREVFRVAVAASAF
ncbi:MAG TPA: JAB domain-containing protein, partial [Verrucomicrobiae bacterium]|nr:JAB domain-containing protein [Verrucomicrobiae bacterium]